MITLHDKNLFLYYCKLFRSLQYSLTKIFYLKLPDIWVNSGKISTRQSRNMTGNLHCPALISTPENVNTLRKLHFYDNIEFGLTNKTKNSHFGEIFENHKFQKPIPFGNL